MFAPEIMYPILTLLLGAGIAYAAFSYLTRNKAKDRLTEEATRREYNTPTRDDRESDI
jgi:hypothetical protein